METTIDTQSEKVSSAQTQAPSNIPIRKGQLGDPNFEVRQFMKNYAQAVRDGNLEEILSFFSDDIEAFECPPPLAFHGIREYSQNWESHFASEFRFPVTYDFVGEKIFADGKIATFTSLLHVRGVSRKNNQEIETWLRLTCVLDKSQGYWQIVHDHMSVPVSEEGCALMNLSPDEFQTH
ncbi:MAG: YybH family protein [Pseudobdellovibrionaceae bacterium]